MIYKKSLAGAFMALPLLAALHVGTPEFQGDAKYFSDPSHHPHGYCSVSTGCFAGLVDSTGAQDSLALIEAQYDSIVLSFINGSGSIAHGLDTSTGPCENHYQFVNGGWRDGIELPNSDARRYQMVTSFSYAHKRMMQELEVILDSASRIHDRTPDHTLRVLGSFYESCMSADSLEPNYMARRRSGSPQRDSTRGEQCLSRTLTYLGGAAGQIFAQDLKNSGAVTRMETLLDALKLAVEERLEGNQVMSASEREYALNRLSRLVLRVGIPDEMVDYSQLSLLSNDYERNKTLIHEFGNSQWVSSIGSNLREKWKLSLLMPNAVYMPSDHAIEIPTLMFSPPFFFREGEDLLNFAGVGYVIGHEIFHSIAMQLGSIESPKMKEEIDSFKAFHTSLGEFDGWKTDGSRTFSEDVADLGGSRVAYRAWKETIAKDPNYKDEVIEGYTPDQRFFIAMGRTWRSKWTRKGMSHGVHGPHWARVNGVAMQNPEFREAFGCKPGDKMFLSDEHLSIIW